MYKRYWLVRFVHYGFESLLLIYGTEEEMQEYLKSELGHIPAYRGATDKEIDMARELNIKAYLCPELRRG